MIVAISDRNGGSDLSSLIYLVWVEENKTTYGSVSLRTVLTELRGSISQSRSGSAQFNLEFIIRVSLAALSNHHLHCFREISETKNLSPSK